MSVVVDTALNKRSFKTLPVQNKRVLVRVDYNVPIDKEGRVTDDSRLRGSLPTLEYLLDNKAKIILIAHLGRPKGQPNPKYSLRPIVQPLSRLLKVPVAFAEDCIGPKAYEAVARLKPGDVLLLENLRFHDEEERNNAVFGKELASYADFFIQDAFGAVHRAHASTAQVPHFLESAAGELLQQELSFLGTIRSHPTRPFAAILGGAKVSDKIGVVKALLDQVDVLFIGGAMAYTFLKAKGTDVGDSLVEPDLVDFCREAIEAAKKKNKTLLLPQDHQVVQDIEKPETAKWTSDAAIAKGWKGVDVGLKTLQALEPVLNSAKTVFWNGPAGIFENPSYAKGTMAIANLLAKSARQGATVVVGGGDSVAAVTKAGVAENMTYISTGGGASLEFLEGKILPGVEALPNA